MKKDHNIIIQSKYVLAFYEAKDKLDFTALFTHKELCKYMAGGAFDTAKEAEELLYSFIQQNDMKKHLAYGIFFKEKLIGHFELNKTNSNEIEMVYLLQKAFWGKGIMAEIINYFNAKYSEILFARILPHNINSAKMLAKVGIARQTVSRFNDLRVIKVYLQK